MTDASKTSFTTKVEMRGKFNDIAYSTVYATDTVSFTVTSGNQYVTFGPSQLTNIKAVTLNSFQYYSLILYDCRSSGVTTGAIAVNAGENAAITYTNGFSSAFHFSGSNLLGDTNYLGFSFGKY
jgi:hypothetical protein